MASGFISKFISLLKGDDAEKIAERICKKGNSAIDLQLASVRSAILKQEDKLTEAEESYTKALLNDGSAEFNSANYIQKIIDKHNIIVETQEKLDNLKRKEDILKAAKEYLNK